MGGTASIEFVVKRDRAIVLAVLMGIALLAWGYMVLEARSMYQTGICSCMGAKMSGPDTGAWSITALVALFLMWTEMMVAMMIPSAAPMILTFATVNRRRREQDRPYVSTGIFLLGYIIVWTLFSIVAALAQWFLHAKALISPMMVSTSPRLGGALLITAGVFQWTPLKNSCLTRCRSPLSFLMTQWREGKQGALTMGLTHGMYCAGCCWFLMALLFVAGVMNLWWIALIAILVLVEKVAPRGLFVEKTVGALLIVWGVWMLYRAGKGG